jgi:hypothetical protein
MNGRACGFVAREVDPPAINSKSARFLGATAVAMVLVLAWTLPLSIHEIADSDFPSHLKTAETIAATGHIPVLHFLFFGSVAGLLLIFRGLSSATAGIIVISLVHLLTVLVIHWFLCREAGLASLRTILATTTLLIVAPIVPPPFNPSVYLMGYFTPNPYHNATFITSKPFCLLLLLAVAAVFRPNAGRRVLVLQIVAVLLAAISKPNYIVCVVPAALVFALWRRWRHQPVRWSAVAILTLTAAIVVVVAERVYGAVGEASGPVILAPFAVLRFHTDIGLSLAAKLLASIAFPLALVAMWPMLLRRPELWLAWTAATIGLGQGYLLAEAGPRIDHANLLVGASQAVFVLMVVSAGALLSLPRAADLTERIRRVSVWGLLLLHVVSGYRHVLLKLNPSAWVEPLSAVALVVLVVWVLLNPRSQARSGLEVMAS